jgi:hypothetical protein
MRTSLRALRPALGSALILLVTWGQLAMLAGCGGHSSTPITPSASPAPASSPAPAPAPEPAPAGATITGTVASASSSPAGVTVGVAGTSASSVSDAGGNFALSNVPPADVVLTFSAAGVSASAAVGAVAVNDVVQVNVTVSGTVATIESQQRTASDSVVDAAGTLADLDVPGRQFRIGSTTVQVATSAVIKRLDVTVSFGDLKNGDRVYVHGMKDGSVIRASQVLATSPAPVPVPTPTPPSTPPATPPSTPPATPTPPAPPPPPPAEPVTITGTITGLAGTCPALSMKLNNETYVRTTSATTFTGRPCAEIKTGDVSQAIGPKGADGVVLAEKLYVSPAPVPTPAPTPTPAPPPAPTPPAPTTITGTITALAGTCPALAMKVNNETYVKTTSATLFTGRPCADIKSGDTSQAIGPKQGDGVILAEQLYVSPVVKK